MDKPDFGVDFYVLGDKESNESNQIHSRGQLGEIRHF